MAFIRIAAVGDIMCGESFYQHGRGPRTHIDRLGAAFLDESLVRFLKSHDLVLGNVECVLSDKGPRRHSLRRNHLRGRPSVAALLHHWGFNVAHLANNHILEQGREAAIDTAAHLRSAGVDVVGAGFNDAFENGPSALEICRGRQRVGIVGACLLDEHYAYSGGGSLEQSIQLTRRIAGRCDLVIVSLHWGNEYMDHPDRTQVEIVRQFSEAGAHLLIGHHPHVLQGVEVLGEMVAAYSLGNFIFDQIIPDARWSAILSCVFEKGRCLRWRLVPFVLDAQHRPRLVAGSQLQQLNDEITRRNSLLARATLAPEDAYRQEARQKQRRFQRQLWLHLFKNFRSFPLMHNLQILARPLQRRTGRW